jgi:hypothetical protein
MKTKTIIIGSLLLLITLFAGSLIVIQTIATVSVTLRITPFTLTEEDGAPPLFHVKIKVPPSSGYTTAEIDPTTVRVEGLSMVPKPEDWEKDYKVTKSFFAFMVNGQDLYNTIWQKAAHMQPLPGEKVNVDVTATGKFTDNTDFTGTCTMIFMTLREDPPPNPE